MSTDADLKEVVRNKYGTAASRVRAGEGGCCGSAASSRCCDPITSDLYDATQAGEVPGAALQASLGCGNPTALAELKPGETVLDLGSGGGIDVILSARRVGPAGMAYGLDMTDEMLALAEENKRRSGLANVTFLKGDIENIPLPDASVDVVISNCVINLAGDKDRVLREAFRVLKPGGRFAVSDVVVRGPVPDAVRRSMELWVGCIAGALSEDEYRGKLAAAGFGGIDLEVTRVYGVEDARTFLASEGMDADAVAKEVDGRFVSAFVRAVKPAVKAVGTRRFHVHLSVPDLEAGIRFYSALFGSAPAVRKPDYAKWMLDDPRVNFAISRRDAGRTGLDHLGLQVDSADDLAGVRERFADADATAVVDEPGASCCYAKSDKHWVTDPQGIAWEAFHTLDTIPTFAGGGQAPSEAACCAPSAAAPADAACCGPATRPPAAIAIRTKSCC